LTNNKKYIYLCKTFNLQIFRRYVMKPITVLSVLIVFFFLGSFSWADIPDLINYQGMLTDNAGNPLNEPRDLTFTIYDAPTNGTALWTETHTAVPIENGLFNVILGGATIPVPDSVFDQPERFLGIKVGTDPELTPRIQLTSVGYAYQAEKADTADYALSSPSGPGGYTWTFRITNTADTTISTGGSWGIARFGNTLYGNADSTHVNLGVQCTTGTSGQNYKYCTVGGGVRNSASGEYATVGGGRENTADTNYATVGGGSQNTASGLRATVGGGYHNTADTSYATVGGGYYNTASGYSATVGGGYSNDASGYSATVGGGLGNTASGYYAAVGGGYHNTASGPAATVGGGFYNTASGSYSFAAGRKAKADHTGAFVWADGADAYFASTGNNQFLIRASGGVGIGTSSPEEMLHVQDSTEGVIKVGTPTTNGNATIIFEEGDADAMALRYDGTENELRIDDELTENTRMVIERSGKVGIGTTAPLTTAHIRGSSLSLPSEAIHYDEFVLEDADAILGLYSGTSGPAGSAITFGEVVGGALVDKWSILRETTGGGKGLRIAYGTNKDQFLNPTMMY
jgi:hypothetical protein